MKRITLFSFVLFDAPIDTPAMMLRDGLYLRGELAFDIVEFVAKFFNAIVPSLQVLNFDLIDNTIDV